MVKAVYTLPRIKHAFFIIEDYDRFSDIHMWSEENKQRKQYFEHILRSTDQIVPTTALQWTISLIEVSDFLNVLKLHKQARRRSSNPPSHNCENLELLEVNLLEIPESLDSPKNTSIPLSEVREEDIIELTI